MADFDIEPRLLAWFLRFPYTLVLPFREAREMAADVWPEATEQQICEAYGAACRAHFLKAEVPAA